MRAGYDAEQLIPRPEEIPDPNSRRVAAGWIVLGAVIAVVLAPYLGALWKYHGQMPPGYGEFPPVPPVAPPPGFDLGYCIAYAIVAAAITGVLIVPRLFGFAAPGSGDAARLAAAPQPRGLPSWFWWGAGLTVLFWSLMWFGSPGLAKFSFTLTWGSFILLLDGWVYSRLGTSLVAQRRNEMLVLAIVSIAGWYTFEYLNYFVLEAWIYPYGAHLLTPFGLLVYYTLSFATVWPAVFEWYMLLVSYPALRLRWDSGPKLRLTRLGATLIGLAGIVLSVAVTFHPFKLFWAIWAAPAMILLSGLELAGFWTPLDPARQGRWSRVILMALGAFLNGVIWEFWNYGSDRFHFVAGHLVHTNPNFWFYRIPYVDVLRPWSEMPLLGYFGYFGFGIICWLFWLAVAHLIGLDPDFAMADARAGLGLGPEA